MQGILDNYILDGAMILIEQAIPCVLHMENRIGEKILKMLLVEGWNARNSDAKRQQQMVKDVQDKVNSSMLGTECRKSNWLINITKQKEIAHQPMTNNHTRKIVDNLEYLIDI